MRSRNRFLDDMVLALVREFGDSHVRDALERASSFATTPLATTSPKTPGPLTRKPAAEPKPSKPTAADLASRANLPPARREVVRELARRFDQKTFLPNTADAREFLILAGHRPRTMKDRTDAFRQILEVLGKIPVERLNYVASSSAHAGPSQLSAISDAISAAGEFRRREREQRELPGTD